MKTGVLALLLLTGGALLGETRIFVGVHVGGYAAPPAPVVVYVPPCPGPGYAWVAGHWYFSGPHRYWRAGYWTPPRYYRPYRAAPRGFVYGHDFRERGREFRNVRRR